MFTNEMILEEFQEWIEAGKSLNDAFYGLLFQAIKLSLESAGTDAALPTYFAVCQSIAVMAVAEGLGESKG